MKAINIKWDIEYDCNGYLPTEVELPNEMTDEDEIAEWLSDEFGFCHYGFELVD